MLLRNISVGRLVLLLIVLAGLGGLLAHKSQTGSVLGRYSATQSVLISAYLISAVLILSEMRSRPPAHSTTGPISGALQTAAALWFPILTLDIFWPAGPRQLLVNPSLLKQVAVSAIVVFGVVGWLGVLSGMLVWFARRTQLTATHVSTSAIGFVPPGLPGGALALLASAYLLFLSAGLPGIAPQFLFGRLPVPPLMAVLSASVLTMLTLLAHLRIAARDSRRWLLSGLAVGALGLWTASALTATVGQEDAKRCAIACGVLAATLVLSTLTSASGDRVRSVIRAAALFAGVAAPLWLAHDSQAAHSSRAPDPAVGGPRPGLGPNVILFVVDTLRADHLNPYGYSRPTSPFCTNSSRTNEPAPSSSTMLGRAQPQPYPQ